MDATVTPRILVAVFGLLAFIVVSNNTAAAIAQPAIGRAFDAGPADVGWVVFGFGTTFAIATALWGGLAARLGVGSSLAVGVLLFSGGSALAAFAPSLPVLIGARAVQGFGAGAIPTLSATAIALQFDGPARSRAIGTVIAGVVVGIALGPLLGGIAEQLVGWQGPVAFGVVALPAAALLYRQDDRARDASAGFDGVGAILVAAAAAAMTFSLNRLPVLGLSLPTAISLAAVALAIAMIVRRWDRIGAFVPRRIVADGSFTSIIALGGLGMGAFLGTLVLIPVAAARVHGLTGVALGLSVLPLAMVAAVASVRNASVQEWLGRRRTTTVSLAALSLGAAGCGLVGAEADPILTAVMLIPLGLGFGLLQAPLVNEVTVSFGDADRPIALGLYNLVYFLGGAVGAAISTGFLQGAIELPILADRALPGFSTSLLILAVGPALAAAILVLRSRAGSGAGFRRARPDEADVLTSLARRSKAWWGYDEEFLARAAADLTVKPADILDHEVWVLEGGDGAVIGFHRVIPGEPAVLEDLWLEPDAIGAGHGRRLWEHAARVARAGGASALELDAEPNAIGFYERMGAVRIGASPSPVDPARQLPRMRIELSVTGSA